MNFREYAENKRSSYMEFAACVASILESCLKNKGMIDTVQQIQSRAKSVDSLEKKITTRNIYASEELEKEIKDLAGCRLIFYHDGDLELFGQSRIISKNFDISWPDSKIHHPTPEATATHSLYKGNHFLVTLAEDRSTLPEYSRFHGLRCEIQFQTLLNHAWSETSHDITYKRQITSGFGGAQMARIENRLEKIMSDYLRPAAYEFQKVKYDHDRLMTGKAILDADVTKQIDEVGDLNQLHRLLDQYSDYVLPNVEFQVDSEQIYTVITSSLQKASNLVVMDRETSIGRLDGMTHEQILTICLDILNAIRYLDIDKTLALLFDMFKTHVSPLEKKVLLKYCEKICGYDLNALNRFGYQFQEQLVDALRVRSRDSLLSIADYAIACCTAMLRSTITATNTDYQSVSWSTLCVRGTSQIGRIRRESLHLLEIVVSNGDEYIGGSALQCMRGAVEKIGNAQYGVPLLNIILRDSNRVIEYFSKSLERLSFPEIHKCEKWVKGRYEYSQYIKSLAKSSKETKKLAEKVETLSLKYRDQIQGIPRYHDYKVLMVLNGHFDYEWEHDNEDFIKTKEYRLGEIDSFIDSINTNNIMDWTCFLLTCASFPRGEHDPTYLAIFLKRLASAKPDLVQQAINRKPSEFGIYLDSVLVGLGDAGHDDMFQTVVNKYLQREERRWECARPFVYSPLQRHRYLLHKILHAAIHAKDIQAIQQVIASLKCETTNDERNTLFLPAVQALTKLGDTNWTQYFYFRDEAPSCLSELDVAGIQIVLDNLVRRPDLGYEAESVILPLAESNIELVLNFFGKRLEIEEARSDYEYDAIPHKFQKLGAVLVSVPEQLVDTAFAWFKHSSRMFYLTGAKLITNTFPEFGDELDRKLIALVRTGDEDSLMFVIEILKSYEGQPFLHNVCMEVLKSVGGVGPYVSEVESILSQSGVIHGNFGFVQRYTQIKEEISYWLESSDEVVRNFAEDFINSLDMRRASEQNRAEKELEMRKHIYGDMKDDKGES